MQLISIQVGQPKQIPLKGHTLTTSYYKTPVSGPVKVKRLGLEGDSQSDLRVHGGPDKAVYAYSADAYAFWNERYKTNHAYGALGENLTFDSLDENQIGVGDIYSLGSCRLQVTKPRYPCFKLGIRFNDSKAVRAFNEFNRSGVYFRVIEEGTIDVDDTLTLISRPKVFVSIKETYSRKMQT